MAFLPDVPANILSVLGGLLVLYFVVYKVSWVLYWFYAYKIRKGKNLRDYGEWAVVTGATDGIGKAYCFQLAAKGLKVLLISRNEAKLQTVQKELQEKYPGVQLDHLAIDFGNFDAKNRELVRSKVEGLDIGVLINNVGKTMDMPKYYYEALEDEIVSLVEVNVNSVLWMTKILLGDGKTGMVARKRGAIINIGSMAGLTTGPLMNLYSASKSYVNMFSRSMYAEMKEHNIHVSVQMPGRVVSQLTQSFAKESLTFPTADTWAKSAVDMIGYEASNCGYWPHQVDAWGQQQLMQKQWDDSFISSHKEIRELAIKAKKVGEAAHADGTLEMGMPLVIDAR